MKLYLGIDIGGTAFKSGIINDKCEIIYRNSIITNPNQTNGEALNNLTFLINDAILKCKIESIGLGLPCVVDKDKIMFAPNLPNWNNIDFGGYIRSKYKLPFSVDNDANAAAICEMISGKGRGLRNFFYITLGTGVGGAIVINNAIYKGNMGGAGEIGHIFLNICSNSVANYRSGALETYIGREAIISNYKQHCKENNVLFATNIDVSDINMLAEHNDSMAIKTLEEAGFMLGIAIATINHILDIGDFIVGGGISNCKLMLEVAERVSRERSLPSVSKIKVQQAHFIQDTGIIGAALLGKIGSI
ncbi:MAG: ROK family protein [Bacteroidetes bacterium]|nr:ROK family protein [Bacteroidota bacterium]